jgi:hypothetical protein
MTPETAAQLNWWLMPEELQTIKTLCGADVALALVEHCDGQRVWVPRADWLPIDDPRNPLSLLPVDMARRLAAHYHGWLHVPRAYHALLKVRNDAIRASHRAKVPTGRLAQQYGLTERMIWYIVGPSPPDARQESLF